MWLAMCVSARACVQVLLVLKSFEASSITFAWSARIHKNYEYLLTHLRSQSNVKNVFKRFCIPSLHNSNDDFNKRLINGMNK